MIGVPARQAGPGIQLLPFAKDLVDCHARHGIEGLVSIPPEWWMELGQIGTFESWLVDGARSAIARDQIDDIVQLAGGSGR